MRGPHRVALIAALDLKKGRKMPRNGRIGLKGQADFAEPGDVFLHGPVRYFAARKKTFQQKFAYVAAIDLDGHRAADQFSSPAKHGDAVFFRAFGRKQDFFCRPA